MEIVYYGQGRFKIKEGKTVVVFGDQPKGISAKIVIGGRGKPPAFVVPAPGEYEIGGVKIWGKGKQVFYLEFPKKIGVLWLGPGWQLAAPGALSEEVGQIHLLLLVGNKKRFSSPKIKKLVEQLQPAVVVPGELESGAIAAFLDNLDAEDVTPQEKLKLNFGDSQEKIKIKVLQARPG